MTALFSKPKIPAAAAAPPIPTIDDAQARQNAMDRSLRRGCGTTVLTGENGLPNLGATRAPSAGYGG